MSLNDFPTLKLLQLDQHILSISLNRPKVRNALNTQMMTDIRDCFREFYVDQHDLRAILLSGSGGSAFCAGGDLKERNGMSDAVWRKQHAVLEQMVEAVLACPIPVIAVVQGSCFGGGLELALTCDFIYAGTTSRFGFPEGKLGIMPGACGTQNLVRACGQRRAKEIMLTGNPFTAEQALDWGILNQVCDPDTLIEKATAVASSICSTAPLSAQQIKKSVNIAIQTDLANGYAFEIAAYNLTVPTKDRIEGVAAFNEKRKPHFSGE